MNFLAHAYLSGNNPKLLVGNFSGDFVKGKDYESFEPEIAKGVVLHRSIDEYTDNHAVVSQSKDRLRKKYRHYSGVIVDIFYDHFLALNWAKHHDQDLLYYTENVYKTLEDYQEVLPEKMQFVLRYMKRDNWLYNYGKLIGIERALHGMSKRTKFNSKMNEAIVELEQDHQLFEEEFEAFMPDIKSFVAKWLNN